jgi:RNA recognition motif-containing protein
MIEKETGRSRGFGFLIMKNAMDAYKIINTQVHVLDNKQIDCKKAVPKDKAPPQKNSNLIMGSQAHDLQNETNRSNNSNTMMPLGSNDSVPFVNRNSHGMPNRMVSDSTRLQTIVEIDPTMPFQMPSVNFGSELPNMVPLQSANVGEKGQNVIGSNYADSSNNPKLVVSHNPPLRYSVGAKIVRHQDMVNEDPDEKQYSKNYRKIFVGGLPHGLTEFEFKGYFIQFGEIEDCVVMYDRNTGKPRGFGFITYSDERSVDLVMKHKLQHKLNGKWIETKRATPKITSTTNMPGYNEYEGPNSPDYYTYNPEQFGSSDPNVINCSNDVAVGKQKPDTSFLDSQSTSANTQAAKANQGMKPTKDHNSTMIASSSSAFETFAVNVKPNVERQSLGIGLTKTNVYFTQLLDEEEKKSAVVKADNLHFEEDKLATYDEMFENFDKSDNGSDWNISLGDPLEAKDSGFPQPLPTSDGDNGFNKYGNKVGESLSNKNEQPELCDDDTENINNPELNIIKENLINLIYEDGDENARSETSTNKDYELKLCNRFSNCCSVGDNSSQKGRFSLDRHSTPHFPRTGGNKNPLVPAENNPFSVCESAEIEHDYHSKTSGKSTLLTFD